KVYTEVAPTVNDLRGRTLNADVTDAVSGEVIAAKGTQVDDRLAERISQINKIGKVKVKPFASQEVVYLTADEDEQASIAQASSQLNALGEFKNPRPSARHAEKFLFEQAERIRYMDVSPKQIVSVSAE